MANYRINNSSSIKISPSRPSYHFPILIEKSTRHSNRQTGSGQHLVAKCVTNPELQGRPPNREVSIESRHKKCGPTFLFNRKRARPGQHLAAKNVTNAELQGRPPNWEGSIEGRHKNAVQPSYSTRNEQDRDNTWWRNMSLTQSPADARPIGDHQPKSKNIRC